MSNQPGHVVEKAILEDFSKIQIDQAEYNQNYEYDRNCLTRHTLFLHTFDQVRQIRNRLAEIDQAQQKESLNFKDVPSCKVQDSSLYLSRIAWQSLQQKLIRKQELSIFDIYKCLIISNAQQLLKTVIFFTVQNIFRVLQSLFFYYLFESVRLGQKQNAYVFAVISGICLLGQNIGFHNGFLSSSLLNCRMRGTMIFMIYHKLSTLTHFSIKNASVGKITNMLSNDFNIIQIKFPLLISSIPIPVGIIGITILLCLRLGWTGIIALIVIIILTPLQLVVGKINGMFLEQANVNKDARVKLTTQIIEGIKFIKLYGWEIAFKKILQNIRAKQSSSYLKLSIGRGVQRTLGNVIAFIGGFAAIVSTYFINPEKLNSATIFSVLQLIIGLRLLIFLLSLGINFLFELNVILQRLAQLFNIECISAIQIDEQTKKPKTQQKNQANFNISSMNLTQQQNNKKFDDHIPITIQNGQAYLENFNGYWSLSNLTHPTLKNINIYFRKGLLYGIGGKIGSGKSGILGVLLQEIPYFSGVFQISGQISYVEQQPIVFSDSIKNNILFGKQMDIDRYNQCLKASCLESDLHILQDGDETIVGEKGMTLSGGQKARLSLARAIYSDSDIYLLDDPLSAVDSKVAKKIFENCIQGFLKGKTIILCTHQVHYLQYCDQIAIMDNGSIISQGTPKQIAKQLNELMRLEHKDQQQQEQKDQQPEEQLQQTQNKLKVPMQNKRKYSQAISAISHKSNNKKISITKKEQDAAVTLWTYPKYILLNKLNVIVFPMTIIAFIICEGWNILYYRFLANYDIQTNIEDGNKYFQNVDTFWGIIGTMLGLYTINQVIKYSLLSYVAINSNTSLHQYMIQGMVRAPASYFDITPSGILINKFSNDIGILDMMLLWVMIDVTEGPIITIILLANVFQVNPFFIPFGIVNLIILILLYLYFKRSIIQSKQLDLRTKSPVFNALGQLISGIIPIKIYGRRISSIHSFAKKVDNSMRCSLSFWYLNRGFGSSLSYITRIILLTGFLLGVYYSTKQTAGLYGASIIFLLQVSDYIQWFSRQQITMESMLVSVQRGFLTINLEPQKDLTTEYDQQIGINAAQQDKDPTQIWPENPSFKIQNLKMKYQQSLPEVLKGVNFKIEAGKKVGIVGRTGAGKSSIIQALLRIYQPLEGSIYEIGDHNAMKMGLHSLRKNISVIPQTPFLFKGTIRQNLDPFQANTDEALWSILKESGLYQHVQGLPNKLDTDVSNSSETFSVGQKQLLCLARALLRKRKILFLDEATSNVDLRTDDLIQKVLKEKFTDTTVITIAHRLNTIADYDQIIVMSRGRVKEIGTPYELIEKKGTFAEMVEHTGKNAQIIINIARQSYFTKKKRAQRKLEPIKIKVN